MKIIKCVQNGDVDAFEVLVIEYEKNVYNLALRMTGNAEDAADMSQEAFIKAFNALANFRGESKFSVWLYRIVTNVCLDFLRKRSRKPTLSLSIESDDGEDMQLDIPDETQSPEYMLEQRMTKQAVEQSLAQLPDDYQQILMLRELQGLSYDEISLTLGIEVGTVKSRIFRARKKLCSLLLKDGNIPDFATSRKQGGGETS